MNRAYSVLEIKSVDDDAGIIEGIATTPEPDRVGDIVEPKGAVFKLPIPLLWQHKAGEPIGQVIAAKVTKAGIEIKARIERGLLPEIDRAWALIKAGLVRGLSIGFRPFDDGVEPINPKEPFGALRFTAWEWLELSAVTIPANQSASIQTIKAIDETQRRAASGAQGETFVARLENRPGASGISTVQSTKGKQMNTAEQISAWEAKRAASFATMTELMQHSTETGESLDQESAARYDVAKSEVQACDSQIARLKEVQAFLPATAKAAKEDTSEPTPKSKVTTGEGVLRVNSNLPKGIGLARYVKAIAFGNGNNAEAREYAKQWDDSTPEVSLALKTAVAAGTTQDSAWAGPLVYNENLASEFLEYLRPQTILGKLQGLRRVPFNVRYPTQTGTSTVAWVGEGAGKPVSKLQFSSGSLGFAKAAGIVVITKELARFSSPAAETVVRDDLAAQMRYFLDVQFIDPSVAAVANVNPASVLNGASNVRQAAATWSSMANVLTDVFVFLNTFATNDISLEGAYWVMTPEVALRLSLIQTTGGENFAFPDISINGGTFAGIPVIVSNSVPHSTSAGSIVALIVPNEIFLADDGGIAIDVSQEASLLMDSAPTTQTSAVPTGSSVVSMFQTNSIAIRAERVINWARRRTYGVGYIDNVHTS